MAKNNSDNILRVLDANLNRAVEGVRVTEDMLRFRNFAREAESLRALRHELREAAAMIPGGNAALLAARDSEGDVARNAPAATDRESAESVATANFKRAQEAARTLEEFSKLISPQASARFGETRFRLYDLEKTLLSAGGPLSSLRIPDQPFLYAVADLPALRGERGDFEFFKALCESGAGIVQLRDKSLSDRHAVEALKKLKSLASGRTLVAANDRADIAAAGGADVLHVGQDDLSVGDIRAISGGRLLIGISTHSAAQAEEALAAKPDYISVGPVFESPTKPDKTPVGVKLLADVAKIAGNIPVVAIGGVNLSNMKEALDAGATGLAMITALSGARDYKSALEKINDELRKYGVR